MHGFYQSYFLLIEKMISPIFLQENPNRNICCLVAIHTIHNTYNTQYIQYVQYYTVIILLLFIFIIQTHTTYLNLCIYAQHFHRSFNILIVKLKSIQYIIQPVIFIFMMQSIQNSIQLVIFIFMMLSIQYSIQPVIFIFMM